MHSIKKLTVFVTLLFSEVHATGIRTAVLDAMDRHKPLFAEALGPIPTPNGMLNQQQALTPAVQKVAFN